MIYVGIDDTDVIGARGTNQLAREIARRAAERWTCRHILRHQLLNDPRIPFTSKNGSASLTFEAKQSASMTELIDLCRDTMRSDFIPGSDPGLCVTNVVPAAITELGLFCQREIVTQEQAHAFAQNHGIHLEGLGGTNGGVIGALAAVGLVATGNDGRIVQWEDWPDDLSGEQSINTLNARQVIVRDFSNQIEINSGSVDVGKHLRPNYRGGQAVLFVQRDAGSVWKALKLV